MQSCWTNQIKHQMVIHLPDKKKLLPYSDTFSSTFQQRRISAYRLGLNDKSENWTLSHQNMFACGWFVQKLDLLEEFRTEDSSILLFLFPHLPIASHGIYIAPSVNEVSNVISALFQQAFTIENWRSLFITPEKRKQLLQLFPRLTPWKRLCSLFQSATVFRKFWKKDAVPLLEIQMNFPKSLSSHAKRNITKAEQLPKVWERFLPVLQRYDEYTGSGECVLLLPSYCIGVVSVSLETHLTLPTYTLRKTPSTWSEIDFFRMNKLDFA